MYDIGSFYEAVSVEDAIRKLQEWPDAEIISGGSDVLIKIREGKMAGRSLVSIHNIAALKGVSMEEDGTLVIGPVISVQSAAMSATGSPVRTVLLHYLLTMRF